MSVRAVAWALIYLGLIVLPLVVLLLGQRPPSRGFWWDFSMGLGFAGMAMLATQFALTARFRRPSSPFGMDIIYYFHRILAIGALAIVLGHFGILYVRYQDALGELNPLTAPWELTMGRVALVCLAGLVISSEFRRTLRLEYGLWRYLHVVLAVIGFGGAVAHIIGVGYYTEAEGKRALWLAVTLSWLGILLWLRIGKPLRQHQQSWRIAENRPERGEANTLVLEPVGHSGLGKWRPGQFAWLTLRTSPFYLREHPFSIASPPEDAPRIELTIKPQGDFTSMVGEVGVGESAYLDGPYGIFSVDRHPQAPGFVFIGGGIGITPLMANLRSLAARGDRRPAMLFYCNPDWDGVVFREKIDALSDRLDLAVVHVLEDPPEGWSGETGFLTLEILQRHLPSGYTEREYFLCGPTPMTKAAHDALEELNVPATQVHTEIFELV